MTRFFPLGPLPVRLAGIVALLSTLLIAPPAPGQPNCLSAAVTDVVWARTVGVNPVKQGGVPFSGLAHDNAGRSVVLAPLVVPDSRPAPFAGLSYVNTNARTGALVGVLDSDSNARWVRTLHGDGNLSSGFIGVDAADNVYLALVGTEGLRIANGTTSVNPALPQPVKPVVIVKLDRDGGFVGGTTVADLMDSSLSGLSVAPNGEVILYGGLRKELKLGGSPLTGDVRYLDAWVARYAADFSLRWVDRASGEWDETIYDGKCDAAGNFTFAGEFTSRTATFGDSSLVNSSFRRNSATGVLSGIADAMVVRLNPNGAVLWAARGGGRSSDRFTSLAVAPNGDLALAGVHDIDPLGPPTYGPFQDTVGTESNKGLLARMNSGGTFTALTNWFVGATFPPPLALDSCGNLYTADLDNLSNGRVFVIRHAPAFGQERSWRLSPFGPFTGENRPPPAPSIMGSKLLTASATGEISVLLPLTTGFHSDTFDIENIWGTSAHYLARFSDRTLPRPPVLLAEVATRDAIIGRAGFALAAPAAGSSTVRRQWKLDGQPIPGATGITLARTATEVRLTDAGNYSVELSNEAGTITAPVATVLVHQPPVITGIPAQTNAPPGSRLSIEPAVAGTPPLSFAWWKDGNALPGQTNRALLFDPVSPADSGTYQLRAANPGGQTNSTSLILRVEGAVVAGALDQWKDARPYAPGQERYLFGITYDGERFLAVGQSGAFLTSADGVTWTVGNTGFGVIHLGIFTGGGARVLVGQLLGSTGIAGVQFDGSTWVARNPSSYINGTVNVTTGGIHAQDQFLVVGGRSIWNSGNGISWFQRHQNSSASWQGITYGLGRFVVVGTGIPGSMTSTDGQSWTTNAAFNGAAEAICFGRNRFVAAGHTLRWSDDGLAWNLGPNRADFRLHSVAFGEGAFVAVGDEASIYSSEDGINWSKRAGGPAVALNAVAYGAGRFVAVGQDGTIRYTPVVVHPPKVELPAQLTLPTGAALSLAATYSGGGTLSFAWTKDGLNLKDSTRITGTTGPSLAIKSLTVADSARYTLTIQNDVGVAAAASTKLTVEPPVHTADWQAPPWSIDTAELEAVTALWRAGSYHPDPAALGKFAPGAGAAPLQGARHDADFREPFWKIDATELNRVVSYWRARSYYRTNSTPDGFAPGPR